MNTSINKNIKKIGSVLTLSLLSIFTLTGCDVTGLGFKEDKAKQAAYLYTIHHLASPSLTLTELVAPCEPNLDCPDSSVSATFLVGNTEEFLNNITTLELEKQLLNACNVVIKYSWLYQDPTTRSVTLEGAEIPLVDEGGTLAGCIENGLKAKDGSAIIRVEGDFASFAKFNNTKAVATLAKDKDRIKLTLDFYTAEER